MPIQDTELLHFLSWANGTDKDHRESVIEYFERCYPYFVKSSLIKNEILDCGFFQIENECTRYLGAVFIEPYCRTFWGHYVVFDYRRDQELYNKLPESKWQLMCNIYNKVKKSWLTYPKEIIERVLGCDFNLSEDGHETSYIVRKDLLYNTDKNWRCELTDDEIRRTKKLLGVKTFYNCVNKAFSDCITLGFHETLYTRPTKNEPFVLRMHVYECEYKKRFKTLSGVYDFLYKITQKPVMTLDLNYEMMDKYIQITKLKYNFQKFEKVVK